MTIMRSSSWHSRFSAAKGAGLGAAVGLLGLLIAAAIGFYLLVTMAGTIVQPQEPLRAGSNQPSTSQSPAQRYTEGLPRQMPSHDGGLLKELSE